jgi:hypothetical protein
VQALQTHSGEEQAAEVGSDMVALALADCTAVRDHSCAPAEAELCGQFQIYV